MASAGGIESRDANVLLRIREDDPWVPSVAESFADGHIIGVHLEDSVMVWALWMPGVAWAAQVAQVEARLDRLGVDWRGFVSLRRP